MGISYNTSVVRNGLVLYLDAANSKSYPGSGTVWSDLSGLGNNGDLVNGVGYNDVGQKYFIQDNIDDHIGTNYITEVSNFTISMWAQRTSNSYWSVLWSNEIWSNNLGYISFLTNSDTIFFGRAGADNFASTPLTTITNSNLWNYYTFSIDSQSNFTFYYNSEMIRTYTGIITPSVPNTVKIGTRHGNTNIGFTDRRFGNYGLIKIHNRVLSASEIRKNFEATRGRYGI